MAYAFAFFSIYAVFAVNLGNLTPIWSGFFAHTSATLIIFIFSLVWSNTSIYDPAWCYFPIALALGWMFGSQHTPSTRGICLVIFFVAWFIRYVYMYPWSGWTTKGLDYEDWRYVSIARVTGSGTFLYWIASLFALHLTPTYLVFMALSPAEHVLSNGSYNVPDLGVWDAIGAATCISAIAILAIADTQLKNFRNKAYHTNDELDHISTSRKTCRTGLWRYSRHPNYFGEALFWLGIAIIAFGGQLDAVPIWRSWGGSLVMFVFFRYSASLMDQRNLEHKRENYADVMRETSALIPWL